MSYLGMMYLVIFFPTTVFCLPCSSPFWLPVEGTVQAKITHEYTADFGEKQPIPLVCYQDPFLKSEEL